MPTTTDNTKVVHRLYNEGLGSMGHSSHYYTSDAVEIARLTQDYGWVDDGESVQYRTCGPTPIFTCYNEALNSAHHYTSTMSEWEGLEQHGWALERDKNGETGVFQCLVGTSWTFEDMQGESSENSYIEFRILEVGEHAGDGSAMTFQTVHVLPSAYRMNTTTTTTGSWKGSELRKVLSTKETGSTLESVYDQMPVGFTGDIISVTKQTSAGAGSSDIIETDDRLWIPSYTEYTGEGGVYTYTEGSIYAFWKNMNISTTDYNYSVELYTRAGNIPLSSTHYAPMWGTRSPLKNNAATWAYNYQGRTSYAPWLAQCPIGISFAFCF